MRRSLKRERVKRWEIKSEYQFEYKKERGTDINSN